MKLWPSEASVMAAYKQEQMSRVEYWNSIKPDPHYIPGLGRGAQGFTTRSDIGPSKFTPTLQEGNAVRLRLSAAHRQLQR
jgi:PRP1 splicing factor, N-terminal